MGLNKGQPCWKPAGGDPTGFKVLSCVSLWENDPTSHLIYHLSKQFTNEFMVSITPLIQDVVAFLKITGALGGKSGCSIWFGRWQAARSAHHLVSCKKTKKNQDGWRPRCFKTHHRLTALLLCAHVVFTVQYFNTIQHLKVWVDSQKLAAMNVIFPKILSVRHLEVKQNNVSLQMFTESEFAVWLSRRLVLFSLDQ